MSDVFFCRCCPLHLIADFKKELLQVGGVSGSGGCLVVVLVVIVKVVVGLALAIVVVVVVLVVVVPTMSSANTL